MQFTQRPIIEASFDGYDDRDPYHLVPKGYLTQADNVFLSDNKIAKVFGSSPIAPSTGNGAFNGLGALNFLAAQEYYLITNQNKVNYSDFLIWTGSGSFVDISFNTAPNAAPGLSTATIGGSISPGTYYYVVTALNASGESIASSEASIVVPSGTSTNTITITFPSVAGATSYNIYRGTSSKAESVYYNTTSSPFTDTGATGTNGTPRPILPINKPTWFESANNYIFAFNGYNEADFNGTRLQINRYGVPIGYYAKWYHSYMFIANNPNYSNRLYFSSIGDPVTYPGTNYVDINPGDSDQIMGLAIIQDELLIFKQGTIWAITGWSEASFASTTAAGQNLNGRIFGYGTISPFSLVNTGNDVLYFSMVGQIPVIRSVTKTSFAVTLDGGVVSDMIRGTMSTITKSAMAGIQGGFDGRYAYWAIPVNGSPVNNKVIVLDTWEITSKNYPFTTMTGKNIGYMAVSLIPGASQIYYTDATTIAGSPNNGTGLIMKFNTSLNTDNGNNITSTIVSRGYMPDPARKFKWKYLYGKYSQGENTFLTISSQVDQGGMTTQGQISLQGITPYLLDSTFYLDHSTMDSSGGNSQRMSIASQTGKIWQWQMIESSPDYFEVYDIETYFLPKGLRND